MRERKKKKRYQRLFWSQRVSVGKQWKIVLDTATDTHCIYIASGSILRGRFDYSGFPWDDFRSYEVRCFHLGPGQPIWKSSGESGPRYTMGVPEVLPHSAQFRTLPSLIPLEEKKNGVEGEIASVWKARKKRKKCVSECERCIKIVRACSLCTPPCAPWHHFPLHDRLVCCNIPWYFSNLWTLTHCHPDLWLKPPSLCSVSIRF